MKGLSINLSGSGASLSIGGRGASLTIGQKGTHLNTGIPGTGIYNRQKISGSPSSRQSSFSNNYSSQNTYYHVSLELDEKGNPIPTITDSNGVIVTDESIIRKVKRGENYKETVEKLTANKREEIENNLKSFIEIYKSTPTITPEEYAEKKSPI